MTSAAAGSAGFQESAKPSGAPSTQRSAGADSSEGAHHEPKVEARNRRADIDSVDVRRTWSGRYGSWFRGRPGNPHRRRSMVPGPAAPPPGIDATACAAARGLECLPGLVLRPRWEWGRRRSRPGKAAEHVPAAADVSACTMDAARVLPSVGHDLQRPCGVRRPLISGQPTTTSSSPSVTGASWQRIWGHNFRCHLQRGSHMGIGSSTRRACPPPGAELKVLVFLSFGVAAMESDCAAQRCLPDG
jgi:hypothetical protein